MKGEKRKVCGTCKHSRVEVPFGEFYCDNEESDCYQCECMYDDYCIDYEEDKNAWLWILQLGLYAKNERVSW